MTERREAQLKLEQMQKHLAEAQKLDALGQLTGGVAHDFNNLLMVISGSLHMLRKSAADDPKVQRALVGDRSRDQARRGADQPAPDLRAAGKASTRRRSLSPNGSTPSARCSTPVSAARVRLAYDYGPGLWPVTVDVSEFETALVNLVINARDAMPSGGTITVAARNCADSQPNGHDQAGDFVAISVADAGVGIAPDVLAKIFDPFFTTKPVGKGTGLGLSQVHGFAHQAGGSVKVESELGKGTTVTILLPRERGGALADKHPVSEMAGSGTVLLVEDNPDVASVSSNLLEQLGYTVRRVADAEAALREIERNNVDLVFSDIVMPGKIDGLSLARRLREIRPDLPILLATGYSDAAADVRGDFPILRKPYEIHQLSQAIAKLPRLASSTPSAAPRTPRLPAAS